MRIGKFRHRVIFRKKAPESQNAFGENTADFTVKDFVCWARIDYTSAASGRKVTAGQQIIAEGDPVVAIRYRPNMTAYRQITTVVGGRVFDIASITNVNEMNRELRFRCTESNPATHR